MARTASRHAALTLTLGLGLLTGSLHGQDPAPLLPDDLAAFDFFGEQVAAADDLLVVSSALADVGDLFNAGKLYVFEPDAAGDWQQTATLTAATPGQNDFLGQSLATDGTRIVAGSRASLPGVPEAGAVDVFVREGDTWVHEQRLRPNLPQVIGRFGLAVDIDDDVIVVGAPHHDVPFENEGEAWVFERDERAGWRLAQVLTKPVPVPEEVFGSAVAVEDDVIVVGIPAEGGEGFAFGGAYVFERRDTQWHVSGHLTQPGGQIFDQYGHRVAIDGGRVVVATPFEDEFGNSSGLVHIYARAHGAWRRLDELRSPDPEPDDQFGRDVALSGDLLAVSALDPPDPLQVGYGTVHLYRWDGQGFAWEDAKAAPLAEFASFGTTIDLADGHLLAGSKETSSLLTFGGSAWVWDAP